MKPYPFDPSIKHHLLISLGLDLWIFIFLYATEPLDVNEFSDADKLVYPGQPSDSHLTVVRLGLISLKISRCVSSPSPPDPTTTPQPTKRSFLVDALYRLSRDSGLHQRPDKYKTAVR